eukprot:15181548-Heterocapsa_arctica.AAC.1
MEHETVGSRHGRAIGLASSSPPTWAAGASLPDVATASRTKAESECGGSAAESECGESAMLAVR